MKNFLTFAGLTFVFSIALAQKDAKPVKTFYNNSKIETRDLTIAIEDAVSTEGETKFKLKIINKTKDFIIYKPEESKFIINGKELKPSERALIIEPNESDYKVINLKGAQYNTVKSYSFVVDGLYKVSTSNQSITVADFKLPASQNDFQAGNFSCSLKKLKKETGVTDAKFECSYNGDKIGLIFPEKASVKMPDGKEYANAKSKGAIMLMKGKDVGFLLHWDRMPGKGKATDMQFAEMIIKWNGSFSEASPEKMKSETIEIQSEGATNPVIYTNNTVIQPTNNVSTQPSNQVAVTEEPVYRGSGDPLKGLNITKSKDMTIGRYYALIIGIDKYKGGWMTLKNAVNDAKAVEAMLTSKYKFDNIKTLYNEQATRANIIAEMESLAANAKEQDNVFIYYSGHGEFKKDMNKGFWVPFDGTTNSTVNYLPNTDVQAYLGGIKSKHSLLVADACFSGDIFRGNTISVPFEESDKYYREVHGLTSRQAMTSGGLEPVMDGGKEGHSVFAYYFLKSLKENQSKYFDAGQLYNKIKIPVINNSEQSPNFAPVKNTGDEGGQFLFIKK